MCCKCGAVASVVESYVECRVVESFSPSVSPRHCLAARRRLPLLLLAPFRPWARSGQDRRPHPPSRFLHCNLGAMRVSLANKNAAGAGVAQGRGGKGREERGVRPALPRTPALHRNLWDGDGHAHAHAGHAGQAPRRLTPSRRLAGDVRSEGSARESQREDFISSSGPLRCFRVEKE